jgi:hypothetical protein
MNVVIDGKGTVHRRPAIQALDEAPTTAVDANGIEGIHCSVLGPIYAIGSPTVLTGLGTRNIYRVNSGGAVNLTSSNGGAAGQADLRGFTRPVFAETVPLLAIAGGQEIQKITLATDVPARLRGLVGGVDPPLGATFVSANASRLLANDPTIDINRVRFSGARDINNPDGYENWAVVFQDFNAGFFPANASPDPVKGIVENTNEVFVFGSRNVQIFRADAQIGFSTVSTRQYGVSAPYSIVQMDQDFIWLDHRRRIVRSDGRQANIISEAIEQDLKEMTTVSDAFGYRVKVGYVDAYVLTFPTDGRTFSIQTGGGWSQWQSFNETSNAWGQFNVLSHGHRVFDGLDQSVVGLQDGRVAQLLSNKTDDLGTRIKAYTETGFINRGSDNLKHCKALHFAFRRGLSGSATEPLGFLSWADQPGAWSTPIPIEFGASGDTRPVVTFRSLGTYRRRAWRFTFSETESDLALSAVTEDFEILEQ